MAEIKQQVIQMIQSLPDNVTIDDIMAELYFKLQVDAGLKELDEGKEYPTKRLKNGCQNGLQNRFLVGFLKKNK